MRTRPLRAPNRLPGSRPAPTAIEIEGLVHRFGDVAAVRGLDIVVHRGEVFALLGPNGAGKTTTIRVLTTLLCPTSGRVQVAGFDVVTEAAQVRRRIGAALQEAAVDPLMTGTELLHLHGVLHGLPRARARAISDELLERLGLVDAAGRRIGTYSGGMKRRLDLALALMHGPEILFLDEPTAGLDPTSRSVLWDEVRRLNGEGVTIVLTTQYLEEADRLAGRVAIIDQGRIVLQGSPSALKAELGSPTLVVQVAAADDQAARAVLASFGRPRPARAGCIAVGLAAGSATLTSVVLALDSAGIALAHLELVAPSLEDVFANATGAPSPEPSEATPAELRAPP